VALAFVLLLVACPNPTQSSQQAAAPSFSPLYGNFSTDQSVTIASSTTGATIYYTTDGTDPTTASATYGSPITVAGDGTSMTIKSIAVMAGMSDSAVTHAYYTIHYPGTLDAGFASGSGADGNIFSVATQNDGKIVIGGIFTHYNGTPCRYIARLSADGSLDTSFATGVGPDNDVTSIAMQKDGKIVIGGDFAHYDGTPRGCIARLNTDGSLDTSFATGVGADGAPYAIAVQGDGKIVIGGQFTMYNSLSQKYAARLNTDGSLDASFANGAALDDIVYAVALQNDGKVLLGGNLTGYISTQERYVMRLNADGSLDTGFATGTALDSIVNAVAVQNDGKVLIGGSFTQYNVTPRMSIARLNNDGSLDASFLVGAGANFPVQSFAVQSDGKILIGGSFTSYNGTSRGHLARLNADGSLDTGFLATGAGANSLVDSLVEQGDGRFLIGGSFTDYSSTARGDIARIWN